MHLSNQKQLSYFFPNQGQCYFDEDINGCEVQLTDSTRSILEGRLILKNFLKEREFTYPRCILYYIFSVKIINDVDSLFSENLK